MSNVVDLYDEDAMFEEMQETLVIEKGQKVNLDSKKRGKWVKEEEDEMRRKRRVKMVPPSRRRRPRD